MNLARFPRRRYTPGPTPLEPLTALSRALGGPEIWIKRDDLLGLAAGGNKTRKLEFLVADALAKGCDTLITTGAVQSNHCRLTAAAAAKEGLKCALVLEERVPGSFNPAAGGNNFLYDLLGVETISVVEAGADLDAAMTTLGADLRGKKRKPYLIPGGGSNALGALGYVACAQELLGQMFDAGLAIDHIVCASGSAGTHAGLLAGLVGLHADIPLTGINVRRPRAEQERNVYALAKDCADLLGVDPAPRRTVTALDDWVGPGYSLPTPEMVEAVRMLATLEGILLDPVYTGKAMAGLIALARQGRWKAGERVLFLHTGGSPALFAYQDAFKAKA
ncbi:MAG TPA: D-cysteine desulfhydrase [Caulobacteraceae bacterium]|jgi:D-cysteine desulfhydrase|nr:D-cysteine desulfhydrase [Caulobacteraceae bacterium]